MNHFDHAAMIRPQNGEQTLCGCRREHIALRNSPQPALLCHRPPDLKKASKSRHFRLI